VPGRHLSAGDLFADSFGPGARLFVGQQGHRRDVAGAMATGAMLVENRRDIFGERRRRRRLRRARHDEN